MQGGLDLIPGQGTRLHILRRRPKTLYATTTTQCSQIVNNIKEIKGACLSDVTHSALRPRPKLPPGHLLLDTDQFQQVTFELTILLTFHI